MTVKLNEFTDNFVPGPKYSENCDKVNLIPIRLIKVIAMFLISLHNIIVKKVIRH